MDLTIGWEKSDETALSANTISVKLISNKFNVDTNIGWDMVNPYDGKLNVIVKGVSEYFGQFEVTHDSDWKLFLGKILLNAAGKIDTERGDWPRSTPTSPPTRSASMQALSRLWTAASTR